MIHSSFSIEIVLLEKSIRYKNYWAVQAYLRELEHGEAGRLTEVIKRFQQSWEVLKCIGYC